MFEQFAQSARSSGFERDAASSAKTRLVTLYRNGFTFDNGPLRDFTSPENAQFLRSIQKGEIPVGFVFLLSSKYCQKLLVIPLFCA